LTAGGLKGKLKKKIHIRSVAIQTFLISIRMISEGSCDEDWSNDGEKSDFITEINCILLCYYFKLL